MQEFVLPMFVRFFASILKSENNDSWIVPWPKLEKKGRNFTMDDHPNFNPPPKMPPNRKNLHPWKTHIGEPKKWRFGVGDFPFLSGQPAGRFVVRPGIWIRQYDSSSPWLWGAAGPMMAQWTTQTNSEFTPPKLGPNCPQTRKWIIFEWLIFRRKLAVGFQGG